MNERLNEEGNLSNRPKEIPGKDKENLAIKFEKDSLHVSFDYELVQTRERIEKLLDYYQFRFSQRAGRFVPREEIRISPEEGDAVPVTTSFVVRLGQPLYVGLNLIHSENPSTLPKLLDDLEKYQKENALENGQRQLFQYTVNELKRIIEPKEKEN